MTPFLKGLAAVMFGLLLFGAMATAGLVFFAGSKSLGGSRLRDVPLKGSTVDEGTVETPDAAPPTVHQAVNAFADSDARYLPASKSAGGAVLLSPELFGGTGSLGSVGEPKGEPTLSISAVRVLEGNQDVIPLRRDELAEIRKMFTTHEKETLICLKAAAGHKALVGRLAFDFFIEPTGKVNTVTMIITTVNDPQLQTCIASRIKQWKFASSPHPEMRQVTVSLPFNVVAQP